MSAPLARRHALRGTAFVAVLMSVAALVGAWGATPAEASSYRFWTYWLGGTDSWAFSSQGASRRPADGTVDGWRFAVSAASSSTVTPRHSPSFSRICGSTPPVDGNKRVGLIVDFGTTAEAPDGETPSAMITRCVVAEPDANGYDVLAEVVQLRTDDGLICGMNGYPATECGVVVSSTPSTPAPTPSTGGSAGGSNGGGDRGNGSQRDVGAQPQPSSGSSGDSSPSKKNASGADPKGDTDEAGPRPSADGQTPATAESAEALAATAAAATTPQSGSPRGLVIGVLIVVSLLAGAFVFRRRRA